MQNCKSLCLHYVLVLLLAAIHNTSIERNWCCKFILWNRNETCSQTY